MKEIKILVLCAHSEILKTILRLIQTQEGWTGIGASVISEALKQGSDSSFDLVLLGSGFSEPEYREFKKEIKKIQPNIPIIQHYGGGSGLLFGEIQYALSLS